MEDILSLHTIMQNYWIKGNAQIEIYYRRKSREDEWIWIAGKVYSFMEQPVRGLIIAERRPNDEKRAILMNRLVRMVTSVAISVQESYTWSPSSEPKPTNEENNSSQYYSTFPGLEQQKNNARSSWQKSQNDESNVNGNSKNMGNDISTTFESVREGPCIDVSKICLQPIEVQFLAFLITGAFNAHDVANYMLNPRNVNKSIHHYMEYALQTPCKTPLEPKCLPPISSLNFSCTWMGDHGIEKLGETLCSTLPTLKIIDVSFCGIGEKGILAFCKSLHLRRKRNMKCLNGLILSCNTITLKAAKELGSALSPMRSRLSSRTRISTIRSKKEGYDEDDESDQSDDYISDQSDDGSGFWLKHKRTMRQSGRFLCHDYYSAEVGDPGIQLLHLSSCSMDGKIILELLLNLSEESRLIELDISSNHIGSSGLGMIIDFLESSTSKKKSEPNLVMPYLRRLNFSDNSLCNKSITMLTRIVARRSLRASIIDLHLSFNNIGSSSIEILMNKLMNHNLVRLSLDNNDIGDSGCQIVAATLMSMPHLSSLNLSFNQIGCRGITSLMKALLGCESLTYLGLSGNIMKISGAIAMGYTLAHHPRLAHLDVDNCCLSQVSQCHISAGMISNRLVPMQSLNGFRVGPPLAAIGALDLVAQHLDNSKCLTIRRNMQMKANLNWMEAQKEARVYVGNQSDKQIHISNNSSDLDNNIESTDTTTFPPQSAYVRMLDWLTRIPFDDEELTTLRKYFYDIEDESPDGLRGSDGKLNLKFRGDLLAALGSHLEQQLRENEKHFKFPKGPSVGMALDSCDHGSFVNLDESSILHSSQTLWNSIKLLDIPYKPPVSEIKNDDCDLSLERENSTLSSISQADMVRSESERSHRSSNSGSANNTIKARISMFPQFLEKLDLLKSNAQMMMDQEHDIQQQDIIAQQFAEASLILLRQLRYHCMNSGLDGWRHGQKVKRKVLIVDDSMVTRKLVARAFEKANFIVDKAENGEEGVKMMKQTIYDIAFMDIDMPVMNGFDATKTLREWENSARPGARQPICALTAQYVDDFELDDLMKFKDAGIDVMESKPCNMPRLFKVVDDVSPLYTDLEQLAP
jgi:CheY-like chemotaxis protein/Ran GTPase-activating protein (RanGAP) involved in mRNA processing and transport